MRSVAMSLPSFWRTILRLVFGVMVVLGLMGPVAPVHGGAPLPQAQTPQALVLKVDGIINAVTARFISRAIKRAEEQRAALVIVQLDTPGGLFDSTREIVTELLGAEVPVVVYVAPSGARAASAGTFITAAANFAVMSPGTNIGAATPIGSGGQDLEKTLASKATNDAAALIRSIAQERGRNQEKLEETVRNAVSFTANEAVELNVVDFIARDLDELLAQLNGRVAKTAAGPRNLDTSDLGRRQVIKTSLLENLLGFISDPNISFLLLTVGALGIIIELFNPGLIAPGVIGAISLLLAFLALGNLPVNWAGVAFIFLAVVLAVLEALHSGFGILGIGSIVSLIVGGLLLFAQFGAPSPTMPPVSVSLWLLGGVAGALALVMLYVVRVIYQSREAALQATRASLVGAVGTVTTELAPRGVVQVGDETWTAVSEDDTVIPTGATVKVTKVNGLIVTVSRQGDTDT